MPSILSIPPGAPAPRRSPPGAPPSFDRFFPQAERLTPDGQSAAWRLRTVLDLDGSPAPGPVGASLPGDPALLAALDPGLAGVLSRTLDFTGLSLERIAFLDIETTGLTGGTGCYAFLVGLGAFEDDTFVVEQYFMDDFAAEPAMLEALATRLADFSALVTFNGRSFDVPFLRLRYVLNRQAAPLHLPNLDLLHPARRIWRARIGSASLGALERGVLGLERVDDVPGSLIPAIYLDYIRGVGTDRMVPVVRHNAQDIASMPALWALLCHAVAEPDAPPWRHASTQVGLAALLRHAGRAEESLARLESAVLLSRDPEEEHTLSMHVAVMHRRLGRHGEAAAIWAARAEVASSPAARAEACLALARHHEHATKDLAEATRWALRALEALGEPPERTERLRAAIAQETARLEGGATKSPVAEAFQPATPQEEEVAQAFQPANLQEEEVAQTFQPANLQEEEVEQAFQPASDRQAGKPAPLSFSTPGGDGTELLDPVDRLLHDAHKRLARLRQRAARDAAKRPRKKRPPEADTSN
jgi:uncharacterized protein YprB with RNaseH-like and TPR domain